MDAPPESDRRDGSRLLACFPAYVERVDGETHTTLMRDLSTTGVLLLVRTKLGVGDHVKLQLFISSVDEARSANGHVVRVEPLADAEIGLWSRKVAVQFDEPLTMYEAEILALRERQERLLNR
jgi:PilZ domain